VETHIPGGRNREALEWAAQYGHDGDQVVIGASSQLPQHTGYEGSEWSAEDRTGLASAI